MLQHCHTRRAAHLLNLSEETVDVISRVRRVQVPLVLLNLFGSERVDFIVDFLHGLMRPRQTSHQPGKGVVELQRGDKQRDVVFY